jgi:hypothetical protein
MYNSIPSYEIAYAVKKKNLMRVGLTTVRLVYIHKIHEPRTHATFVTSKGEELGLTHTTLKLAP